MTRITKKYTVFQQTKNTINNNTHCQLQLYIILYNSTTRITIYTHYPIILLLIKIVRLFENFIHSKKISKYNNLI